MIKLVAMIFGYACLGFIALIVASALILGFYFLLVDE